MCGIVGYIGDKQAQPILLEGLQKLEYRGYDSAGIAVISPSGKLNLVKRKGKLKTLRDVVEPDPLPGTIGIGHTRWATHGEPSERNSHPHTDCTGEIAAVHNGIIENFHELREQLKAEGHQFKSDTDTETIPHLVEKYLKQTGDIVEAFRRAINELEGAYAIGLIWTGNPDIMLAARKGSPLIIGVGEGENFIASDVPAILRHTRKVIYLDDGEWAVLTRNSVEVYDLSGKKVEKKVHEIEWDAEAAEKGGYPHFMIKEIFEQPRVLRDVLRGRFQDGKIYLSEANLDLDYLKKINKIMVVACGTAFYAGLTGKYLIEKFTDLQVEADIASEFRYREPKIDENTLFIAVSQSGETADTLASLRAAKEKGAKVISIVNVVGSTIARESDGVIYTQAGPEIGVASTKAYTSQQLSFYILTLLLAQIRGTMAHDEIEHLEKLLHTVPDAVEKVLENADYVKKVSLKYVDYPKAFYLGRYLNYPNALEGALKLKEIAYTAAEGYPAGEMKHGPIALVDDQLFTVALSPESKVYEKMLSNIQEIKARNGVIIGVASEGDTEITRFVDDVIYIPRVPEEVSPPVVVVPLQLIAYYIAAERGNDVDQPRNLAKSVTVE